jgi:hypothetical protein
VNLRAVPVLSALLLASTAMSGCVAAAIPVLAGSAIMRAQADDNRTDPAPAEMAPPVAATPEPMPEPAPPAPVPQTVPANPAEAPPADVALASRPAQFGFAQFVRYGRDMATSGTPLSAMLADPIALDGVRRSCIEGERPVALIDLDPANGVFDPPAAPGKLPGLALGLAVLREAGVVIAWITDLPVTQSGALRTALEQAGLDPRGEDIISLPSDDDDRKQLRRDNLAANACIIAIAGDERRDFDERFAYLRQPDAGAMLEPIIGNGWFLIEPVLPASTDNEGQQTQ